MSDNEEGKAPHPMKGKTAHRIPEERYVAARILYETTPGATFKSIAAETGISWRGLEERSKKDGGWAKRSLLPPSGMNEAAQQVADRYTGKLADYGDDITAEHKELAALVGRGRALYFTTGYMANLAVAPTLVGRDDAIFADKLNHASLIDAALLARAEHVRYPHGDVDALARRLEQSQARRKLILTDAVFSMDGDLAPLPELFALAERFDAWLVVDDAHGFGVLGPGGQGSLAHFDLPPSPRLLLMGTLGKAAGVSGAFVAGDRRVIEWLMQRARSYIFTTASSPILAAALLASLELIAAGDERRAYLQRLILRLRDGLSGLPWRLLPSPTAIQPLLIGGNEAAVRLAERLFARGLWVPAIRPPTVPAGTARLRISLSSAHRESQIDDLIAALHDCADQRA